MELEEKLDKNEKKLIKRILLGTSAYLAISLGAVIGVSKLEYNSMVPQEQRSISGFVKYTLFESSKPCKDFPIRSLFP